MIIRRLDSELRKFIAREDQHKSVLIVQGARQVGKTYLIESTLSSIKTKQVAQFNLERDKILRDEINRSQDFEDFEKILKKYGFIPLQSAILFIDEAQESLKLGSYIRFMKEQWKATTVILSGSSISKLFSGDLRVPVGRMEYLRVTPIDFPEYVNALNREDIYQQALTNPNKISEFVHQELLQLYDRYLEIGGLPNVVSQAMSGASLQQLAQLRMEIYLSQEEDFTRKENGLKAHLFRDGTRAVAELLGQPFSLTRISPNHRDAKTTLETLCEWLIAYKCDQKTLSPTSEPRPKLYLYDIGLARQLRETSLPMTSFSTTKDSATRTALGGLVENAIYLEMQQGKKFLNEISGWRKSTRDGVEVDFIYKLDRKTVPIEVKCSDKIDRRKFAGMKLYLQKSNQQLGIYVSTAPYEVIYEDGLTITNLPVYLAGADMIQRIGAES